MTKLFDGWQPVVPAKGQERETALALLAIAKDVRLVRTDGNGTEFLVPAWVAEAFTAPAETPAAPKRRRSRAKEEEVN